MKYILHHDELYENCIFCKMLYEDKDKENHILYRGQYCYIIMNLYPYTGGHLMVVPYTHVQTIEDIDDSTLLELTRFTRKSLMILRQAMRPEGFNIGANIGVAAGAGIEEHFHLHIVPRWAGDTSFMTTVGELRVVPEHIDITYEKLKALFDKDF